MRLNRMQKQECSIDIQHYMFQLPKNTEHPGWTFH